MNKSRKNIALAGMPRFVPKPVAKNQGKKYLVLPSPGISREDRMSMQPRPMQKSVQQDPTDLRHVLNALKSSSKGSINKGPRPNFEPHPDDVCHLKYVGDISHLSIENTHCSFRELPCTDTSMDDCALQENNKENIPESNKTSFVTPTTEHQPTVKPLTMSDITQMELLLLKMAITSERKEEPLIRTHQKRTSYINSLKQIRKTADETLRNIQEDSYKSYEEEKRLLKERKAEIVLEAEQIGEEYRLKNEARRAAVDLTIQKIQDDSAVLQQQMQMLAESEQAQPPPPYQGNTIVNPPNYGPETILPPPEAVPVITPTPHTDCLTQTEDQIPDQNPPQYAASAPSPIGANNFIAPTPVSSVSVVPTPLQPVPAAATPVAFPAPEAFSAAAPVAFPAPAAFSAAAPATVAPTTTAVAPAIPEVIVAANKEFQDLRAHLEQLNHDAADISNIDADWCMALNRALAITNQFIKTPHDSSNRDKYQLLCKLLNGVPFTYSGNNVSTDNHPVAVAFIQSQIPPRLIKVAHELQPNALPVYASVILKLWTEYPHLGVLFYGHLGEMCPYLVPKIITRTEGESEDQYKRKMGHRFRKDGALAETFDQHCARMLCLGELYGYIVSMEVSGSHPHGLRQAWMWLARLLATPPMSSAVAAVLAGFISVAGDALLKRFGRQFQKLLLAIQTEYVPEIEAIAEIGSRADITKLKLYLKKCIASNNCPTPKVGHGLLL